MSLRQSLEAELGDVFDDVPDDELLAMIEAALPRYLLGRLRSRLPLVVAGIGLVALLAVGQGDESSETASPSSAPNTTTAVPQAPVTPANVPAAAIPSNRAVPSGTPQEPFPEPSTSATTPAPPAPEPYEPLRIIAAGYSSATGGTPFEADPGPDALPVRAGGGQHLRRSFVRLEGTTPRVLRLALHGEAPSAGAELAAIDVCPITAPGWQPARGAPLDAGPTFDASACIAGQRLVDGTWTFDIGALRTGDGVALVPSAGTSATFEVVFTAVPLGV